MAAAFSQPKLARLVTLLGDLRLGTTRIPRFQRPPVWTSEQRLLLLESLYSGYPIGAILTWNTTREMPEFPSIGPIVPLRPGAGTGRLYVLDGHQRLATLFGVFGLGLFSEKERLRAWDQRFVKEEWQVWFDVRAEEQGAHFVQQRPRGPKEIPVSWVPLDVLLDTYALTEQIDRLRQAGFDKPTINRVMWLADRVREYIVPVIELQTDDLEVVTASFQRLNSAGTSMNELHMLKALCWKADFDLEERVDSLAGSLTQPLWRPFARERLLDVAKLMLGLPLSGASPDTIAERLRAKPTVLRDACEALEKMTFLLAWLWGPAALPYAYQALLLALVTEEIAQPDPQRVWVWFLSTTFTEAFAGGSSAKFRRAREHLAGFLSGKVAEPLPEPDVVVSSLGRFDFNSALGKGQAILLANAWYRESHGRGEPMERSTQGFQHLATFGAEALMRFPAPDTVAEHATLATRFLGVDGVPYTRTGGGWVFRNPRAHLVDPDAERALLGGDVPTFLRLRLTRIEAELRSLTGGLPRPGAR